MEPVTATDPVQGAAVQDAENQTEAFARMMTAMLQNVLNNSQQVQKEGDG